MNKQNIKLARGYIKKTYADMPIPKESYLGLMTARSGSTLLCAHLEKIGYGKPIEAFNPNKNHRIRFYWDIDYSDPYAFIKKAIEFQTVNGVMGMKFSRNQFKLFQENAQRLLEPSEIKLNEAEIVEVFFPGTRYIHLQRRNKVKQAISYSKALQSGIWNETADKDESYKQYVLPAMYDREHIECCYDILLANDVAWQHYLQSNELPSMLVWFEDLIKNYRGKMQEVYDYLEIKDKALIDPPLRQQSNKESLDWEARFLEETPWVTEEKIRKAMETGDLSTLWLYRSQAIATQKEQARWKVMPANRFKPFRTFTFRVRRKLTSILKRSKPAL